MWGLSAAGMSATNTNSSRGRRRTDRVENETRTRISEIDATISAPEQLITTSAIVTIPVIAKAEVIKDDKTPSGKTITLTATPVAAETGTTQNQRR